MTCPQCRAENAPAALTCLGCGQSLPPPRVLGPGSVLADRYEIVRTLGAGGMGLVFEAQDRKLDLRVAVKIVRSTVLDPESRSRFRSEVKLARKVRHRNVCAIHDYGEDGAVEFISMELVEGKDLRHVVHEAGSLASEPALELALQIAEGLAAIHEAGIIHRDLKPANIMVEPSGSVRVMDFGVAKVRAAPSGSNTQVGVVVGTPEYMSPEQVRGREIDFRSDLYAFGVVIYEVFTGRVPFHADTPVGTMLLHLEEPPPLDPASAPLPKALVPLLRKALAKDPSERFATCLEMLEALRALRPILAQDAAADSGKDEVSSGERSTELLTARARAKLQSALVLPPEARLLLPMLARALRSPEGEVRLGAVRSLALHREGALPFASGLEALLGDPVSEVREAAALALRAIAVAPPPPAPTPPPGPSAAIETGPAPAFEVATAPELVTPVPAAASPAPRRDAASAPSAQPAAPRASPRRKAAGPEPLVLRGAGAPRGRGGAVSRMVLLLLGIGAFAALALRLLLRDADRGAVPSPPSTLQEPPSQEPAVQAAAAPAVASRERPPLPLGPSPSPRSLLPPSAPPSPRSSPSVRAVRAVPVLVATTTTTLPPTTTTTVPPVAEATDADEIAITTTTIATTTTTTTTLAPIEAPRCTSRAPAYPLIALQRKREGTVRLRLEVDEKGRVLDVQVLKGVELLTEAAVRAAWTWVCVPGRQGGTPLRGFTEASLEFRLPR